jgi:hypothetical protein
MGQWVEDPPPDPETDPGRPPEKPTPVRCEQCGREYTSADMVWWVDEDCPEDAMDESAWMCPHEGCRGTDFGWDIRPTDPSFIDPDGRRILRPGEKIEPASSSDDGLDDIPF